MVDQGVNVMLEQTANDLGFTELEPTPKILRMANQQEVIPVGKLSQVLTRMGDLEYRMNYVVIRLPIQSSFQVLLGRPWLYKAGVLEDWKRKEFRIGSVRIPWKLPKYKGETISETDGYTDPLDADEDEGEGSDCWMVVNAFKTTTEGQLGFPEPEEEQVEVKEFVIRDPVPDLLEPDGEPVHEPDAGAADLNQPGSEPGPASMAQAEKEGGTGRPLGKGLLHALGAVDVPLTRDWVHQMLREDPGMQNYTGVFERTQEEDPSPIVKALEYKKLVVQDGMEFYVGTGTTE